MNLKKTGLTLALLASGLTLALPAAGQTTTEKNTTQTAAQTEELPEFQTPPFFSYLKLPKKINKTGILTQTPGGWCGKVTWAEAKTPNKKRLAKTSCYLNYLILDDQGNPAKTTVSWDGRYQNKKWKKTSVTQTPQYTDNTPVYLSASTGQPVGWCEKNGPINILIDDQIPATKQQKIREAIESVGQKTNTTYTFSSPDTITNLDETFVDTTLPQTINIIRIPPESQTYRDYPQAVGLAASNLQNRSDGKMIRTHATIGLSPGILAENKLLQAVTIHELGHTLGLGHTLVGDSVMRGDGTTTWGTSMTKNDIATFTQLSHLC